jgi:hypothetical protein
MVLHLLFADFGSLLQRTRIYVKKFVYQRPPCGQSCPLSSASKLATSYRRERHVLVIGRKFQEIKLRHNHSKGPCLNRRSQTTLKAT